MELYEAVVWIKVCVSALHLSVRMAVVAASSALINKCLSDGARLDSDRRKGRLLNVIILKKTEKPAVDASEANVDILGQSAVIRSRKKTHI